MLKTRFLPLSFALLGLAAGTIALPSVAAAGGDLRIARDEDAVTFDPMNTILNSDIWVLDNMNASLVRVTPDGTKIEPDLAEKWSISDDAMTYTFVLRDGLKFSDGSPIKASDVKFSLERARDLKGAPLGSMLSGIKQIDTPDDKTIIVKLDKPSAPMLSTLAMFAASILPEAAVKAAGEDFGTKPVGAGAFMLSNWTPGDRVVLVRNPNYWEASRVKLDKIEWLYVPNDNTRVLKLQAGEVDAAIFVPFNMIDQLKQDPNIQIHLDPSSREDFMLINEQHKPLDDVRVRQAICMAIDRQAIVKAVLFDHGTVANSFIPAGALYYSQDNPTCKYDPEGAKKLLADAGVSNLSLKFLTASGNSIEDQTSVMIKDNLAKVGIDANIVKSEVGQTWNLTVAGEYDISIEYWTNDIIDPDEKASFALYGTDDNRSYYTGYHNPRVTDLINQGRTEMDPAKRQPIYAEMQKIASDEVNWVDLYYSPFRNASRKNVKGFFQNPTGRFMLEDTEITQ